MKGRVVSRTPGSWTLIYDLPPDVTGKRKQKYETFKGITKKQAKQNSETASPPWTMAPTSPWPGRR